MTKGFIFSAIGTPLDEQEGLCVDGLRAHLDRHAEAGIDGILVAGTMGATPLLADRTYADLLEQSVKLWAGRGTLLVGIGDTSLVRTRARLRFASELNVDGVVVLSPTFLPFSQDELVDYYRTLADESRKPLYLYDLPQRTAVPIDLETAVKLADHPNIVGIKCSGDLGQTRRLADATADKNFRVIVAAAPLLDVTLHAGFREHVDGVYCIVPRLVAGIRDAAARDDWTEAADKNARLNGLLGMLRKFGVFPSFTALMNHQGVPGSFAPRPFKPLSPESREALLSDPATLQALQFEAATT
jgi:4-hydroxy-tetrahydrodipicolinate synthase